MLRSTDIEATTLRVQHTSQPECMLTDPHVTVQYRYARSSSVNLRLDLGDSRLHAEVDVLLTQADPAGLGILNMLAEAGGASHAATFEMATRCQPQLSLHKAHNPCTMAALLVFVMITSD